MSEFVNIMLLMLSTVLVQNFIFAKFYGICPFLGVSDKPTTALGMGLSVTFVITLASAATWAVYYWILEPFGLSFLKTIAFILIIAALVQLIEMLLKKFVPSLYQALGIYLPLITTNCAVLGVALLNIQNEYNFVYSIAFGFSAAIGFMMAILIFAGVRARLAYAECPKTFRGMPLVLLSAALVAMAFSGFSGIKF